MFLGITLPETNSKFTPENGWVFHCHVSFREGYISSQKHHGQVTTTSTEVTLNGGLVRGTSKIPEQFRFINYTNLPRNHHGLPQGFGFFLPHPGLCLQAAASAATCHCTTFDSAGGLLETLRNGPQISWDFTGVYNL